MRNRNHKHGSISPPESHKLYVGEGECSIRKQRSLTDNHQFSQTVDEGKPSF